MKRHIVAMVTLVTLFITTMTTGCQSGNTLEGQRKMWERQGELPITFAVVGRLPFLTTSTDFMKGAEMAVKEINASGGTKQRLVQLEVYDDEASVMSGTMIAQELVTQHHISAVIGHTSTHVTLPASTIYEEGNMLMISPVVSNSKLTQREYEYIFQNIPGDDDIGREMAVYAYKQGIERIVIHYANNEYGRGLANAFETAADDLGLTVVDRVTRFHEDTLFRRALKKWKAMDYQAVFIADSMLTGGEFLHKLKHEGEHPIIFADAGMDIDFINTFGDFGEGATLASLVNVETGGDRMTEFLKGYETMYQERPDEWAVQGYETIYLLAEAVGAAKSPAPHDVAQALRDVSWQGLTGVISFDESGRVQGKTIFQKRVTNGTFVYESNNIE